MRARLLNIFFVRMRSSFFAAKVCLADWNEAHQKLATCDDAGLIVVWVSHATDETWFEEM